MRTEIFRGHGKELASNRNKIAEKFEWREVKFGLTKFGNNNLEITI